MSDDRDRSLATNPRMCTECGDRPANTAAGDARLCVTCDPEQGTGEGA